MGPGGMRSMRARTQRGPRTAALLGGAFLVAAKAASRLHGRAFVATPPTAAPAPVGAKLAAGPAVASQRGQPAAGPASAWPVLGGAAAIAAAAAWLRGTATPRVPQHRSSLVLAPTEAPAADEPLVAMRSDGGRRKRLGVGGKVCMLTGRKKIRGWTRSFSEHKTKRYFRPNTRWKKLWWEREQKWVRLYVSSRGIRMVDTFGLEKMARWAGLDLYAWSRPHWMPGSRQPLQLKVGYTMQAKKDKKLWPDYISRLNQGAALSDIYPDRDPNQRLAKKLNPLNLKKGEGTPPKNPKRLEVSKMVTEPKFVDY